MVSTRDFGSLSTSSNLVKTTTIDLCYWVRLILLILVDGNVKISIEELQILDCY